MKISIKAILFLSTAYLVCSNGGTSIMAMQQTPPSQKQHVGQQPSSGQPGRSGQRGPRGGPVQTLGRGGGTTSTSTQRRGPSSITEACNKCAREIEEDIKQKTTEQTMKSKIVSTGGNEEDQLKHFQDNCLNIVKANLLEIVVSSLAKEFEYLDQPVPNEQKIEEIITQACNMVKSKLDTMIEAAIVELNKPVKKSISKQLPRNSGDVPQQESFSNLKLKKTTQRKQEETLTPIEQAEVDIAKIQPDNNTEIAKKTADQKRLEAIKEYLNKEKSGHTNNFTDAELLAFPLAVIVNLGPNDLEDKSNQGFGGRKYSNQSLETIKNIRFHPSPMTHTPARMLTAEDVKNETPLNLMRHNLSITEITINKLKNEGHLH